MYASSCKLLLIGQPFTDKTIIMVNLNIWGRHQLLELTCMKVHSLKPNNYLLGSRFPMCINMGSISVLVTLAGVVRPHYVLAEDIVCSHCTL